VEVFECIKHSSFLWYDILLWQWKFYSAGFSCHCH